MVTSDQGCETLTLRARRNRHSRIQLRQRQTRQPRTGQAGQDRHPYRALRCPPALAAGTPGPSEHL